MEETSEKGKWLGELLALMAFQWIMLLFRLVDPIEWPSQLPRMYMELGNQILYFGIDFILVIWIVAHHVFGISFKELGITRLKENIGTILLHSGILAISIGADYLMSQFSKPIEFDGFYLACQIITNFVAVAWIKELIFRGFAYRAFYGLTNGKGLLASLLAAFLCTLTYVPSILVNLEQVTMISMIQSLLVPFILFVYLGILYWLNPDIWTCTVIHGTFISMACLEQDFVMVILECIYGIGLAIYLIVKIVGSRKGRMVTEEESEIQDQQKVDMSEDVDKAMDELPEDVDKVMDEMPRPEIKVEVPNFKSSVMTPSERIHQEIEQTFKSKKTRVEKGNGACHDIKDEEDEKYMPSLGDILSMPEEGNRERASLKIVLPTITKEKIQGIEPLQKVQQEDAIKAEDSYIAYLEQYLGEFEAIYRQVIPSSLPIDLLYFKGEKADALVTNGMRKLDMDVPKALKDYQNIELMIFIDKAFHFPEDEARQGYSSWFIRLLSDLAAYPQNAHSYLGWGHIVGNGEDLAPYDESVDYCGALIYPPIDQEDASFCHYIEEGKSIFIYNVMPLYKEELMFIQTQSSEQFINLMAMAGVNQCIKRERRHVVSMIEA